MKISYYLVVYFFLLFVFGCNSNLSPAFKIGDRVKVTCKDEEYIGVIEEPFYNVFTNSYSYRVYCNTQFSYYSRENLELVDPMPATLEASCQNPKQVINQ